MTKILALWATPRSTSTAFEWVMANRGDMTCFHEPYNEAFYYAEDRRHNRYFDADPSLLPTPGLTFQSVHKKLNELAKNQRVFIKDFAYSVTHVADSQFLDVFCHSFLIRNPEKVLTSMHYRWPDITLAEIGFQDLHTLFKRIADRQGFAPPVIDSDELLNDVEAGMRTFCKAVDIPFIAEAMNWSDEQLKSRESKPTWNSDEHGFHDSLKSSTGLSKQKRQYPPLQSSDDMMRLYKTSLPHYEALYQYRLRF